MWQKKVKPLVESGRLTVIGVVQEQHPDRTRLYRQWRKLDWPIFVDSLNLLDVKVVPIPVAIDASGIVRHESIWPNQLQKEFLDVEYPSTPAPPGYNVRKWVAPQELRRLAKKTNQARSWRDLGDACFLQQSTEASRGLPTEASRGLPTKASRGLQSARSSNGDIGTDCDPVAAYRKALDLDPKDGPVHFRLGVALRARYESRHRQSGDAQDAVAQWEDALAVDPNQYIWRRRIQQYGPRLDKPYNFYFWVDKARKEINARGETPVTLSTEPMGSEIAPPVRGIGVKGRAETADARVVQPQSCGRDSERIQADSKKFVHIETMVTPARVRPGHRVRVRLALRLNESTRPYWNNESDEPAICFDTPPGLTLGEGRLTAANPTQPETREDRYIEFELAVARDMAAGRRELPARALYYVCENKGGKCRYLRRDFTITLNVDPDAPLLR